MTQPTNRRLVTEAKLATGLATKADTTDARLTDQRVPTDGSVTDAKVGPSAAISADKLADGTTGKILTAAERTKLAGVATGATANAADAQLRDRSTHTGTQATSTVTGLDAALTAKQDAATLDAAASALVDNTASATAVSLRAASVAAGREVFPALTGGRLKIGSTMLAPEEIGAAVPATSVVAPAASLVPSGGSQGVTMVATSSGVPLQRFRRTAVRIIDSFDRADSATTAGSTNTGQAWSAEAGTWGIQGNRLYNVTAAAGNRLIVPTGVSDGEVTATFAVLPGAGQAQLVHRFTDASNYVWAAVIPSGSVILGDTIAGTFTTRATSPVGVYTAGQTLTLRCVGTTATVLVGGVPVLSFTSLTVPLGTSAGIRNGGDTTGNFRVDDFYVGDDERASGLVVIPSHWTAYDVSAYITNLTTSAATGNTRWRYEEKVLDLAAGTSYNIVPIASATVPAPAAGVISEIPLATARPRGSGLVAFGITRRNASILDTLNDAAGLLAVTFRQSA